MADLDRDARSNLETQVDECTAVRVHRRHAKHRLCACDRRQCRQPVFVSLIHRTAAIGLDVATAAFRVVAVVVGLAGVAGLQPFGG